MIKETFHKHLIYWEETGFRADTFGDQMSLDWLGSPARDVSLVGERSSTERVERYLTHGPIGSAQECVDGLAKTIEITGIRRFALAFEGAGNRKPVLDSMHRFSSEVIPHLH